VRTVLLRHTLPDGSSHLDWMIEIDPGARLVTFRLAAAMGDGPFEAERIGDHRRDYLDYQGPVPGGRGEVERVVGGEVTIHAFEPDRLDLTLDWGTGPTRLAGRPADRPVWRFEPKG